MTPLTAKHAGESTMNDVSPPAWRVPAGLLLLSILPLMGGTRRLVELTGAAVTQENARFLAAPWPIALHIVFCSIYFVVGAAQFVPSFRSRHRRWHRAAGRLLVLSGLIATASGIWMALFYPPLFGEGTALTLVRLVVGFAVGTFICLGFAFAIAREFDAHRAWMIRAYALSIAAGTQPFTLAIAWLSAGRFDELNYTAAMTAAWLLNAAFAEWIIRRKRPPAPLIAP
jgi:hypothetical protein